MKYAFIEAEKAQFPVVAMCRVLKVSKSGFYAWRKRPESNHARQEQALEVHVRAAHEGSRRTYGSPRVHAELARQGLRVSRKRVARLMRRQGLAARVRRRYRPTTMSDHDQPVAANVLERNFAPAAPDVAWVADTTEIGIGSSGAKAYIAVVLDLYSRFVIGWALSAVNDRHLTLKALDMALRRRGPRPGLLHHSDQGSTYASEAYQRLLAQHGIKCSMSRRGNCHDNAPAESLFSTLTFELGDHFESYAAAKAALFDYIEVFYNHKRRHSTLGYLSPAEFERRGRSVALAA